MPFVWLVVSIIYIPFRMKKWFLRRGASIRACSVTSLSEDGGRYTWKTTRNLLPIIVAIDLYTNVKSFPLKNNQIYLPNKLQRHRGVPCPREIILFACHLVNRSIVYCSYTPIVSHPLCLHPIRDTFTTYWQLLAATFSASWNLCVIINTYNTVLYLIIDIISEYFQ